MVLLTDSDSGEERMEQNMMCIVKGFILNVIQCMRDLA